MRRIFVKDNAVLETLCPI